MKPLNSKERSKAYYKVAGWFVLCFVLAMILGFSTLNINSVTDFACRRQLDELRNSLIFQETVFQPNIDDATRKLQDFLKYKEKQLVPADIATSINVALEKIKKEWKVDETDKQYLMYKNILDVYFGLESAYINTIKLEEKLEAKDNAGQNQDSELQRELKKRDSFEKENQFLKSDKENLIVGSEKLQNQIETLQNQSEILRSQLVKCRDSLRFCLVENRGYKQQRNK